MKTETNKIKRKKTNDKKHQNKYLIHYSGDFFGSTYSVFEPAVFKASYIEEAIKLFNENYPGYKIDKILSVDP